MLARKALIKAGRITPIGDLPDATRSECSPGVSGGGAMKICVVGPLVQLNVSGQIETLCESLCDRTARAEPELRIVVFGRDRYIGKVPYIASSRIRVAPAYCTPVRHFETLSNTFVAI